MRGSNARIVAYPEVSMPFKSSKSLRRSKTTRYNTICGDHVMYCYNILLYYDSMLYHVMLHELTL